MEEANRLNYQEPDLLAEVEQLRQEVRALKQANSDLEIALTTISEHGDMVEAQLHESNLQLQAEIAERKLAQNTLQEILETVSRDKADLELVLKTTAEHGDMLEYQLYTQAVETMRQSEELFRVISESMPILMILTARSNGAIAYANSAAIQRFSVEGSGLEGQTIDAFSLQAEASAEIQALLAQQGYVRNYEMQMRAKDNSLFWVSASVRSLTLDGEPRLLYTLYDISDRKRAEEALLQSEEQLRQQAQELERRVEERTAELRRTEEKYRSLFENAAGGIFQITPEGRFLLANPTLAELYGYDSPLDLMTSITDVGEQLYVQPRRFDELTAYLKGYDTIIGFESQVRCKDGKLIWISENVRALKAADGTLLRYEGSVQDVTDRKTTEEELRQQRLVAERLLLNVLPQPIAERLKHGEKTIADSFREVTVMFADIANFTELSSDISPKELLELLNTIFSAFDRLADRHRLEKIKTIGDAYMVVGGLPKPKPNHVGAIADMALDMQQAITRFRTKDDQPISLRIGIHTGPVVAGVIGTKKFIYDLWGDTVNIASRMEAQGESGRIQVTTEVYNSLKIFYQLEQRGTIEVKGKGNMRTYWLLGKKPINQLGKRL